MMVVVLSDDVCYHAVLETLSTACQTLIEFIIIISIIISHQTLNVSTLRYMQCKICI